MICPRCNKDLSPAIRLLGNAEAIWNFHENVHLREDYRRMRTLAAVLATVQSLDPKARGQILDAMACGNGSALICALKLVLAIADHPEQQSPEFVIVLTKGLREEIMEVS